MNLVCFFFGEFLVVEVNFFWMCCDCFKVQLGFIKILNKMVLGMLFLMNVIGSGVYFDNFF